MKRLGIICLCIASVCTLPQKKSSRIVGGDVAQLGQFPWQVAVYIDRATSSIICGGVILSEEWILTAGHCLPSALQAKVETGVVDLDTQQPTVSQVSRVEVHNEFQDVLLLNDVGLLQLEEPLVFNDNIHSIPISSELIDGGVEVTVSGWGAVTDETPSTGLSRQLHYANLLTLSNDDCRGIFGEDIIDEGRLCAQSEGEVVSGPCTGDSGDPLVIDSFGDPRLVGIVSFISDAGCHGPFPSGYSRITFHLNWIRNITGIAAV